VLYVTLLHSVTISWNDCFSGRLVCCIHYLTAAPCRNHNVAACRLQLRV